MTPFQISEELINEFKVDIESHNINSLKKRTSEYHYADLAEIVDELTTEEGLYLIKLLDSEKTSDVLTELDDDTRDNILELLSVKEIVGEIDELDTDDAVDIISELPTERQEQICCSLISLTMVSRVSCPARHAALDEVVRRVLLERVIISVSSPNA